MVEPARPVEPPRPLEPGLDEDAYREDVHHLHRLLDEFKKTSEEYRKGHDRWWDS